MASSDDRGEEIREGGSDCPAGCWTAVVRGAGALSNAETERRRAVVFQRNCPTLIELGLFLTRAGRLLPPPGWRRRGRLERVDGKSAQNLAGQDLNRARLGWRRGAVRQNHADRHSNRARRGQLNSDVRRNHSDRDSNSATREQLDCVIRKNARNTGRRRGRRGGRIRLDDSASRAGVTDGHDGAVGFDREIEHPRWRAK
jgi:hypothetical protein